MSAKQLLDTAWDIEFAYQGKTARHWKTVETVIGTERDAERAAEHLYAQDQRAVDLLIVPANEPRP